ncbi:hypothetical protein AB5I41_24860 [Sphingomonas sp. MMS24-JH45]
MPKTILATSGKEGERLSDCHWATNDRLLCRVVIVTVTPGIGNVVYTRLVAVDADGKDPKIVSARQTMRSLGVSQNGGSVIDWQGDGRGGLLLTRDYIPEQTTGSHTASTAEGLGVERVDIRTLRRVMVERARDSAIEYISDGNGAVRIMGLRLSTGTGRNGGTISDPVPQARQRDVGEAGRAQARAAVRVRGLQPLCRGPKSERGLGFRGQGRPPGPVSRRAGRQHEARPDTRQCRRRRRRSRPHRSPAPHDRRKLRDREAHHGLFRPRSGETVGRARQGAAQIARRRRRRCERGRGRKLRRVGSDVDPGAITCSTRRPAT